MVGPNVDRADPLKVAPFARWSFGLVGKSAECRARGRLLAVLMVSVTVLQRFAVPGTKNIAGIGFALGLMATLLGLMRGSLRIDPNRLVLYVAAISGLLVTLLVQSLPYSVSSFLMLAVIYFPFIAMFSVGADEYKRGLNIFQRIMALLAVAGLLQMAIQLVVGSDWIFPLDRVLPEQLFISQFNLRIPISDSMPYLKSNGLVFLEPSHFSQFLAFSVLIEIAHFRRWPRLVLLAAAYLTSFSGTGAILLLAVAMPLMVRGRQYFLLALAVSGIMLLPLLHDVPPFSLFFARLGEFANPLGSGSMRFLGPYWMTGQIMHGDPIALLFGNGPGSVAHMKGLVDYDVLDTSWFKLLVEYGVIGVASFFPLYLYVLFANSPDRLLSFACLVHSLLLGGFLNSFYAQFLYLALVGWPRVTAEAAKPSQYNGLDEWLAAGPVRAGGAQHVP